MAATPPLQIREDLRTPPTPLHGAAYDNLNLPPSRHSTRLNRRRILNEAEVTPEAAQLTPRKRRSFGTPGSSRRVSDDSQSNLPLSPRTSPRHKIPARRVQILSPSSPEFGSAVPKSFTSSNSRPAIFSSSSTITMADGMLPTPIKTPKKTTIPKINATARALFQDRPVMGEEVAPPPRRARKQKRYNGFSLEAFDGEDSSRGRIQIFTDSRDQIPQADKTEENPFVDAQANAAGPSVKRVAGGSKRRKISGEKKKDPQVAEAIKNDEGMVYVFRGKKVYRKFDDDDEEEEIIDPEDLGLLEHTLGGSGGFPEMKTLTRKSIKPKRLFQTEEQKRAREIEKEEEAATDIEDHETMNHTDVDVLASSSFKKDAEAIDIVPPAEHSHSLRSTNKEVNSNDAPVVDRVKESKTTKKSSPFDTWRRVKSTSKSATGASTKGKKREASEMDHS